MQRQQLYNLEIVYEVLSYLLDHPEMRFIQALWALGIADGSDLFYEPSARTYEKIQMMKEKEKKCQNIKDSQES